MRVVVGALRLRGGGCCGSKPDSAPRNSGPRDTSGLTILTLDAHGPPPSERATREASVSAASEEAPERNASDEAAAAFQWSLEAGGACDLPEDQLTAIAEEAAVARKSDKVDIDEGPWKEYDGKLLLLEDAALGGEAPALVVPYGGQSSGTYGVFIDFCSLPQKDAHGERTPNELALFSKALGSLDELYSHPKTWILKASRLPRGYPAGFSFPPGSSPNQAAYYDRGWCFCESSMGNLVKSTSMVVDCANFSGTKERLPAVLAECLAGRAPPLHPDEFARQLESKSFTSKKADLGTVAALYRRAFEKRVGEAVVLTFHSLSWGDEDAKVLAVALRGAPLVRQLKLDRNRIGDEGVAALTASLRAGAAPRLETIRLSGNRASVAAMQGLRDAREGLELQT